MIHLPQHSVLKNPQPPSWRTTPYRLLATAYSIYSQLPSIPRGLPSIRNLRTCHATVTRDPPNMALNNNPDQINPVHNFLISLTSFHLCLGLPCGLFSFHIFHNFVCISPICAIHLAHPTILDLIALIIFVSGFLIL
jgi:hypothetical protein